MRNPKNICYLCSLKKNRKMDKTNALNVSRKYAEVVKKLV